MTTKDKVIEELVSLILMQEEEIKKLEKTVTRIRQYIEVYEEYLEGVYESKWQQ